MRISFIVALAALVLAGVGAAWVLLTPGGEQFAGRLQSERPATTFAQPEGSPTGVGRVLYYQDPSGAPFYSATPKKDANGRDYIAIRAPGAIATEQQTGERNGRKILYYRNPMGLPDTSPTPKKDSMGMDYIPVYADEADAPGTVRISLDKVQRLGVRTEAAKRQVLSDTVILAGTLSADERKLAVVALKFPANITKLHVAATGQKVKAGDPLFEINSPFLLKEELDLALALRNRSTFNDAGGVFKRSNDRSLITTRQRLQLYEVPEREIRRLVRTQQPKGQIVWPAPQSGTVVEKSAVLGMRAQEGDVLYRLADLSTIWVLAEAPETALAIARPGAAARVKLNAFPGRIFEGKITFVYPEVSMTTRTARVRIELANPDAVLLPGMFASVEVVAPAGQPVLAVPESAVIDSGQRQVVLVARGEGLFEPRGVTIGRRGAGVVEILAGLKDGEIVVTSATFLIDAESNLRAALQAFTASETAGKGATQ